MQNIFLMLYSNLKNTKNCRIFIMPDKKVHSFLTQQALNLQQCDFGDCKNLINEYSSYPDFYFSERYSELEKYIYFLDNIQFHYLPDTPYNELYRYWKMGTDGGFLSKPFVNENFRHAEAGFTFYFTETVKNFSAGKSEEARKYLGCLLHMLQDSTFGFHTLEGAGGTDGFFLDRITGVSPSPSYILAGISPDYTMPCPEYEPEILGNSIAEAVMMLYGSYCKYSESSRKAAFKYVMCKLGYIDEDSRSLVKIMHDNAVKICADVIKTAIHLANGKKAIRTNICKLQQLEPYQFPFGGFGAYRFVSFMRDCAVNQAKEKIPLELNGRKIADGISFGSHFKGNLCYKIAPETFRNFSAAIGMHSAFPPNGQVEIQWLNNGQVVEKFTLTEPNPVHHLKINNPEGIFGLNFSAAPSCGIIVIGEPHFEYAD